MGLKRRRIVTYTLGALTAVVLTVYSIMESVEVYLHTYRLHQQYRHQHNTYADALLGLLEPRLFAAVFFAGWSAFAAWLFISSLIDVCKNSEHG